MKILWCSPHGDGWSLATHLREAGNKVVLYNPKNKNGLGYLPTVTEAGWIDLAKKADLVVCDGVPDSRRTRRSWAPSDLVNDLQLLRHHGVPVVGPCPTTELIQNDLRYQRKILKRHNLDYVEHSGPGSVSGPNRAAVDVTLSRDPDGRTSLVFRHRHLLGDRNGPDVGNLADIVLPLAADQPIIKNSLGLFDSFLEGIAFRGYFSLSLSVAENQLQVRDVQTGFLYPGVFVQFSTLLLGPQQPVVPGAAVSVLDFETNSRDERSVKGALDYPGVFGAELHRKPEDRTDWLHGQFVGAVVGIGNDWQAVEQDINRKLNKIVADHPGLGFRTGVTVASQLKNLHDWGWIS